MVVAESIIPLGSDSLPALSESDSLSLAAEADTLAGETLKEGIVLTDPGAQYLCAPQSQEGPSASDTAMSWVFTGLTLLFCICALKFRGNMRYFRAMISDLTDTRTRHNAFDDTVRETSLLVILNVAWVVSAGILLWQALCLYGSGFPTAGVTAWGICICTGVSAAYLAFMTCACWMTGKIFGGGTQARLWLKGASSANALETFLMFPIALLSIVRPEWGEPCLVAAAVVFIIGKIVFFYKGYRIFFNQMASWLLFLYYLCGLEIVPLVLAWSAACAACGRWL